MKTIKRDYVLEYINDKIYESRVADSYEDLKLFCQVEGINTTKQQIKTYLKNKAKEDGVDLNIIFVDSSIVDLVSADENLVKRSADRLMKEIAASKYKYYREDLQHFNNLFRIYTLKCLKICSIISMIAGRRMLDKELMQELDITIDEKEILISDVDRLLVPLKHNYELALAIKFKAEQMITYLNLNMDRVGVNKAGIHYAECLPISDLQDYFGLSADKEQFIALTDRQRKEIDEQTIENFKYYINDDIDN